MNRRGLNGNQLKLIAVVAMLFDHIGYRFVEDGILLELLRAIGRVAFPVFCFLLVEGFFHTRSRRNYALRLAAFAVISEIPFDLMSADQWVYWSVQNVFFTLLLGVLMLEVLDRIAANAPVRQRLVWQLWTVLVCSLIAWLVKCDYDYTGIMLIAMLYLFRYDRKQACLLGFLWVGVMESSLGRVPGVAASFWLISQYNGERGRTAGTRTEKYFFYLFYPTHILMLYLIDRMMVMV